MSRYLHFLAKSFKIWNSFLNHWQSAVLANFYIVWFHRNSFAVQNLDKTLIIFQVVKSKPKNGFADNFVNITGPPPKPKPRKAKSNKTSTFQSHVMENWETHSPVHGNSTLSPPEIEEKSKSAQKRPSFKSHAQVPTGDLIDF